MNLRGCRQIEILVHCRWEIKWYSYCAKQFDCVLKFKNGTAIGSSNSFLGMGIYTKRLKAGCQSAISMHMFIAALLKIAKK